MPKFRATVWHLSSTAEVVEGYAGVRRFIVEEEAQDKRMFEARIRDRYIHDVDADVSFGPITRKEK